MPDFAGLFLNAIGAPATPQNRTFVNAWARAEGTAARNNPLATTQPAPGAWLLPGNSSKVKQYPTLQTGVRAEAQTLLNGRYPHLVSLLRSGRATAGQLAAQHGDLKTWGTGDLVAKVLHSPPGSGQEAAVAPAAAQGAPGRTAAVSDPQALVRFMLDLNQAIGSHSSILPALADVHSVRDAQTTETASTPTPTPTRTTQGVRTSKGALKVDAKEIALAHHWGLKITSGVRSEAQNKAVGGATHSYHLTGRAIDVMPTANARKLADYARQNPTQFTEFFGPVNWRIKNGKLYAGAQPDHEDHFHIVAA